MENAGWEIKPLGWIALILLFGVVIYFTFFHIKPHSPQVEQRKKPTWSS